MSELKIGWLFPDTLFLHGERGNLLALKRYAQMAGMNAVIDRIDFNTKGFQPLDYDVIFCAPGEISSFGVVAEWLAPYKEDLGRFIEEGRPLIVTGTSVALFGNKNTRTDGTEITGLGLAGLSAKENDEVYGDDNWFECEYNGHNFEIIGNQIQMNDIILEGDKPFGKLKYGYGNSGKDREEGAVRNNSIFTNTLGPMLVCNPWLTMEIIKVAAEHKGEKFQGIDYDMELEKKSFETKKRLITTKESRLVNCK